MQENKKIHWGKLILRLFFICFGLACIVYTIIISFATTWNIGVILPAIIGLPLLIIGVFWPLTMIFFHSAFGKVVYWIVVCGYALFICSFIFVMSFILREEHQKPAAGADAIIVLGAGLRGERVSSLLAMRLNSAYEYWKENPNAVFVVSGGQGFQEVCTEASAMARYLIVTKKVPADKILLEEGSASTEENFAFSKLVLDEYFKEKPYRIVFATSHFHVFRSEKIAKKMGIETQGIPSPTTKFFYPIHYLREYLAVMQYFISRRI